MSAGGEVIPLRSDQDVVVSRHLVRKAAQELGFSLVDQTKLVTAASELARNTVKYSEGGELRIERLTNGARVGLRLVFVDGGPGIPDLGLAMTDGWSSGNGLGLGLTGARRLVNEFEIESKVPGGTRIAITRWRG